MYFFAFPLWAESLSMEGPLNETKLKSPMKLIKEEEVKKYPHNAVLSVESHFKCGDSEIQRTGTCFLIGDGFSLTAAHVVFHKGKEAHKILCYIGRHGSKFVGEHFMKEYVEVNKYVYSSKYKCDQYNEENYSNDYALLYLGNTNGEIKDIKPILPVAAYTKPINDLFICGYPGISYNEYNKERNHDSAAFPYECKGSYLNQNSLTVSFSTPCFGGMSGSPIRFCDDGHTWKTNAILVNSKFSIESTHGCILTEKKIKAINLWKDGLLKVSNEKGYFDNLANKPFLETLGLDKGSPHFVNESENCSIS